MIQDAGCKPLEHAGPVHRQPQRRVSIAEPANWFSLLALSIAMRQAN